MSIQIVLHNFEDLHKCHVYCGIRDLLENAKCNNGDELEIKIVDAKDFKFLLDEPLVKMSRKARLILENI